MRLGSQSPVDPNYVLLQKEALLKYFELSSAEESFKKQKARVRWLKLGDHNTIFFHRKMSCNRMRNKILSICDEAGQRVEDPGEIKRVIVG